jgi:pimeloyl-ACP methyl ester carboxylesterase
MSVADLGEVRLFYTDDGQGENTLLLVHGWGADSHEWAHHIPALRETHRVIAADLRGHGYSSAPPRGNTPRRMAGDLAELLATLGVRQCLPVGHSMGAQVVSHLSVEHPDLVSALVTVEPGFGLAGPVAESLPAIAAALRDGDPNAVAAKLDRWSYTAASPAWLREWHRRRLLATPPHVLTEAFEAMFVQPGAIGVRPAADAYLARRDQPVLTFWRDPAQAAWEAGLFKDTRSRAITWQGSGHRLHEERPAEFLLVLDDWLRSLG